MHITVLDPKASHEGSDCLSRLYKEPNGKWACLDCRRYIMERIIEVEPVAVADPAKSSGLSKLRQPNPSIRDFLFGWIECFDESVFYYKDGKPKPDALVESLSVEKLKNDELSEDHQQALTSFRHMNQTARLRAAELALIAFRAIKQCGG